jgi:hypothetical protein
MRLVFATVMITGLAGTCCGQDGGVGAFTGMINGQNSVLVVRDYFDGSKLDGYRLLMPSKHIILVDGNRLRDKTWSLIEYDDPERQLGTLTCSSASSAHLQCTQQSGTITSLKRLPGEGDPTGQIKAESEEFARRAYDAVLQRRFREAVYYLKLYRVTSVNHPWTQNWEALFEAEQNNTVASFYDEAMACKDRLGCSFRQEPFAFVEAERHEMEEAKAHYRAQCRENNTSHVLPPPFTCLMYAALNEQLGNTTDMWRGYDLACVQLSFACVRAFGRPELQLISDITQKLVGPAQAELLNARLNVNAKRGEALFEAVSVRSTALVRALLERGADPNLRTGQVLLRAAYLDDLEILRVLLDHRADPNLQQGESALEVAIEKNNIAAVKALIDKGADVNYNDYVGAGTPLMDAVESNNLTIVKILLDAGADPTLAAKFHDRVSVSAKEPAVRQLITQVLLACKSGRRVCAEQKSSQ